ncbi:metalloendoproteinase 5-MMP-like [Arachis duranensis]|uniref:Metalloendoproteinase 5-MMP-like n=1 Tax=Arachis duranensis TaxID=130453 RepID=A0A6P4DDF7_ARADU|nr:metalloendoproteinase 5-MMP-like [Arachis duranensis]
MKPYLLSLLLIFVLLDTVPTISSSLSFEFKPLPLKTNNPKLTKNIQKALDKSLSGFPKSVINKVLNKELLRTYIINYFKNTDKKGNLKSRRPPSNFTKVREEWHKLMPKSSQINKVEIDGLKTVKEYLSRYGYMPRSKSFTNVLDLRTESAIEDYQKFFNLKATGTLDDKETVKQISLLRCGVPDVNSFQLSKNVLWPLGTGWFPKHRTELTYGFYPASKFSPEAIKVFRDSFKRWSLPLRGVINFTEAKAFDKANIQIGYGAMNELFGVEAVGTTFMVKPSNYHRVWMVIDYSKYWAYPDDNLADTPLWKFGVVDLEMVAMHQIGLDYICFK